MLAPAAPEPRSIASLWQASIADLGYVAHREFFAPDALARVEEAISDLFWMQARKLNQFSQYRDYDLDPRSRLEFILNTLEDHDKEALYQVQKFLSASREVMSLYDDRLIGHCAEVLDVEPNDILIEGPGLFVNKPKTFRLLYKWHAESHYYPKRRKFLNLWLPIFGDKTEDNGAMKVMPGSHKEIWASDRMAEYDTGPNTFRQYEIPENFLTDYEPHTCEAERGDLILFDRNLVHRSSENTTRDYSFAMVARVWSPREDLTISGDMAVTPYGNAVGRTKMQVAA